MALPSSFDALRSDWTPQAVGAPLGEVPDLGDLIAAGIRAGGSRPALTDRDGTHSYTELDRAASALAVDLYAAGVRPGTTVVIHCPLSRWAVVAMLGVLRAGAQYVPVDAAFPVERRMTMIRESGAIVAVVGPQSRPELPPGCTFETVLRIPERVDGATPESPTRHGPDLAAYTLFTSGSSGAPKGVVVSRHCLAYSTQARLAYYPSAPSVYLLCSSISFDSSVAGIYWAIATGAHLVIPSPIVVDTVTIRASCERYAASHVLLIPSLYSILLESDEDGSLSSLRTVIVAGEACPPELVRRHFDRLPDVALYNEYGPTECTVWALAHRCQLSDGDHADVPIGQLIPGSAAYLRTDDGPAATGQVGELWLGGPGVALGYTAEPTTSLVANRIYRTGDFARLDDHGLVHYHGRRDGQLKLAGARVELQEIEHAMSAAAEGRAGAVGVVRQAGIPTTLVGFIVSTPDELHPLVLRCRMRSMLPHAAVPAAFCAVDQLPHLSNGKLDRHTLDRMAAGHRAASSTSPLQGGTK